MIDDCPNQMNSCSCLMQSPAATILQLVAQRLDRTFHCLGQLSGRKPAIDPLLWVLVVSKDPLHYMKSFDGTS